MYGKLTKPLNTPILNNYSDMSNYSNHYFPEHRLYISDSPSFFPSLTCFNKNVEKIRGKYYGNKIFIVLLHFVFPLAVSFGYVL